MKKFFRENWLPSVLILLVIIVAGGYFFANFAKNPSVKIVANNNQNPYNITNLAPKNSYTVKITETEKNGAPVYDYSDASGKNFSAGQPLIFAKNSEQKITVENETSVATNVHWHGIVPYPADQDGALNQIKPGAAYTYDFATKNQAGTFWYHSHTRPVSMQVSSGMFGPLVVKDPAEKYDLDQIYVLGTAQINGDSSRNYSAMSLNRGQIARLRFIDQSVEYDQTVNFPFSVKVISKDGENLAKPYFAKSVHLWEGQRVDVEVANLGAADFTKFITVGGDGSNTGTNGMDGNSSANTNPEIPVVYNSSRKSSFAKPVVAPADQKPSVELLSRKPDFTLALSENMSENSDSGMDWTINGQTFSPDMARMNVKVGQTYKIEFTNPGMMGVAHPMHIHGAHFQVIAIDGKATNDDTFYDTYPMAARETTDIAIRWDEAGTWVIHCHILVHEDDGMMAVFQAS